MDLYVAGRHAALDELGLEKTALTQVGVSYRKDPFTEIHHRITQAFKVRMPKFDVSAQLNRLMQNPFKQPTMQLAGKFRPLRI